MRSEMELRGRRFRRPDGTALPPAATMRAATALVAAAALVAACGSAGGDGAAGGSEEATPREEARAAEAQGYRRVVNVEVRELTRGPFTEIVRVAGRVEAEHDVTVSAEESGTIVELPVEKGSRVRKGDVIARIDDSILRAQVAEARARAGLARETFERRAQLYREERAISELSYLEAKYGAEEAEARLAALEARLARTRVRAPVAGVLDRRHVEVGSTVSPGTAVARVIQLDPIKVTAGVPERYAADVRPGAEAEVGLDVVGDRTFTGTLTYVGSTVDRQSRTLPVELTVRNPDRTIKPEMVATVEIVRRRLDSALVVPQGALVRREEGFVAFVVEDAEAEEAPVARVREVELGPSRQNRVVVTSGLRPGDLLVVVGQQQVADGDRVKVVRRRGE